MHKGRESCNSSFHTWFIRKCKWGQGTPLKLLLPLAFIITAIGWLRNISQQKVRGRKQKGRKEAGG